MQSCDLGRRESAEAVYIEERQSIILLVRGDLPNPCYSAEIEQSLLDVEPPAFELKFCRSASYCEQIVVPYNIAREFRIGVRRDIVVLRHAEGEDQIQVRRDVSDLAMAEAGTEATTDRDVTGYGQTVDEALSAAVKNIGSQPRYPDEMFVARVSEWGRISGGIAGFHHVFVTVRRRE